MSGRLPVLIVAPVGAAFLAGIVFANYMSSSQRISTFAGDSRPEMRKSAEAPESAVASEQQGAIRLSDGEIEAAGISVAPAQAGTVTRRLVVPGTIVPNADRIAHVAVR